MNLFTTCEAHFQETHTYLSMIQFWLFSDYINLYLDYTPQV